MGLKTAQILTTPPIFADEENTFRAVELCFAIALMLTGAYPMVYCIQKYFGNQLEKIGRKFGFSKLGATAIVGTMCNWMALFRLFPQMRPKDKVRGLAFSVLASYIIADALSFTMNFQPNFFLFITAGKLFGGIIAVLIADIICKKTVEKYEAEDRAAGIIKPNEYL